MKHIKKIKLDVDKDIVNNIQAVQYDSGSRFIHASIQSNGQQINLKGTTVTMKGVKPSNKPIFNSCKVIDEENGVVEINITSQMLAEVGAVPCQCKIIDGEGDLLSTKLFNIVVIPSIEAEEIESTEELDALNEALGKVQNIDNKFGKVNEQLDAIAFEFNKVVANVTNGNENATNSEIVQARGEEVNLNARLNKFDEQFANIETKVDTFDENLSTSFDGKELPTADDRINYEVNKLQQQINNSSLIEYEGNNIAADKTYYGMTRDMLIKGRTLQNLTTKVTNITVYAGTTYTYDNGIYNCVKGTQLKVSFRNFNADMIKTGIEYTIIFNNNNINNKIAIFNSTTSSFVVNYTSNKKTKFTLGELGNLVVYINNDVDNEFSFKDDSIQLFEGDFTNVDLDIPFFEGVKSVGEDEKIGDKYKVEIKSCGMNLFNKEKVAEIHGNNVVKQIDDGVNISGRWYAAFNIPKLDKTKNYYLKFNYKVNSGILELNHPFMVLYNSTQGKRASNTVKNNGRIVLNENYNYNDVIYLNIYVSSGGTMDIDFTDIIFSESDVPYEPYREDVKEILLDQPLCGLQNLQNTINRKGVETRKIVKIVADNKLMCRAFQTNMWTDSIASFLIDMSQFGFPDYPEKVFYHPFNCLCNLFAYNENILNEKTFEGFTVRNAAPNYIGFNVLKSKLSSVDENGFKKYLIDNNFECYVGLVDNLHETIDHNQLMELQTYNEKAYISSTNSLPATISCKVPSNTQALLQEARNKNVELTKELEDTKEELNVSNENMAKLAIEHGDYLVDTDFRVTMLELGL